MSALRAAEFGPLIVETDIDQAVIAQLRLWLPHYLLKVEEERGLSAETLARPRAESYEATLTDAEFLDRPLPAVLVTTAASEGDAQRDGDGNYYAAWQVIVTAVVRGDYPAQSRWVAALFGGSVRRCLVQQQNLDGITGCEIRWARGSLAPLARAERGRYLTAAMNTFIVYAERVMNDADGPTVPPIDPYRTDPENPEAFDPLIDVGDVTVQVDGRPTNGGS